MEIRVSQIERKTRENFFIFQLRIQLQENLGKSEETVLQTRMEKDLEANLDSNNARRVGRNKDPSLEKNLETNLARDSSASVERKYVKLMLIFRIFHFLLIFVAFCSQSTRL